MSGIANYLKSVALPLFVFLTYLFLYLPIVVLVVFSFNQAPFPDAWKGFSWMWYKELMVSPHIWSAFENSLIVSVTATFLSLLMGVFLVYYHVKTGHLTKLLFLFYGNLVIPEVVLAVGLLILLSFCSIPLGIPTLIIAHTVLGLGFAVPIIYAQYKDLDYRLMEASLDLGANSTQTFFKIILPLLTPSIIASGLLIFIISFDDFLLSFFCAGSSSQTLSLYLFTTLRAGVSPVVNALATVLLIFSSLLVFVFCSLRVKSRIF
ncbi:MAG: potI [Chlamydiales bacterium]|jgi:spermidine/putrescine transport system permease protein|nr:potI [Chlamydiales bacterium]